MDDYHRIITRPMKIKYVGATTVWVEDAENHERFRIGDAMSAHPPTWWEDGEDVLVSLGWRTPGFSHPDVLLVERPLDPNSSPNTFPQVQKSLDLEG